MSVASSTWKCSSTLGLVLMMSGAACSKKAPEPQKLQARAEEPAPDPPRSRPLPAPVAVAPAEPAPIDPALVPVEEDFRKDAEQKLTNKSDLRSELQRIERDISAPNK